MTIVSAVAGAVTLGAIPAQAEAVAYPTTYYDVASGSDTSFGLLTWYNRGVGYDGEIWVSSETCGYTRFETLNSAGQVITNHSIMPPHCNNLAVLRKYPDVGTAPADIPGGAASVRVCFMGKSTYLTGPYTSRACETYRHP